MSRVVLSALVWAKLGCLESSPGCPLPRSLPPKLSGSACLGLGVLFFPDRLIYDLSRAWSNQRRQRAMERQRNDRGAFLCTQDPHIFRRKTHRWISHDLTSESVCVWEMCSLSNGSSHTSLNLFFNIQWSQRRPTQRSPSETVRLKWFSLQPHGPSCTRNWISRCFQTPYKEFGSLFSSHRLPHILGEAWKCWDGTCELEVWFKI